MPDARVRELDARFELQSAFMHDPWKIYPIWPRPFVVKILMVTDGSAQFGRADFGLSALRGALATPPGPWVRFEVTTAHRRSDPAADLNGFTFTSVDLTAYDEIWMYAVERAGTEISDAEVAAIARFMDGGGGVFATGDHEDLGVAMCGRVPRVRSMRRWYWPNPGPHGEPVAPRTDGPDRYDTLSAGNDPGVQFDDQSDDVPQTIHPTLYSLGPWSPYFHRARPHPVLCGPRGVITVLPDHPHEGVCEVPADLTATLTYGGYTSTEYPGGTSPQVIATSRVRSGAVVTDTKGVLNPRTFGAIGAYDGHDAAVGRVVVDSTWHHHFDINLIGVLGSADPVKGVGFDSTPAGHRAYEDIKAYYRNIAVWLARRSSHQQMWWRALWWARWHHRLVMDLRPPYLNGGAALDLAELLRIGAEARDALGRAASQCTVHFWIIRALVEQRRPKLWEQLRPAIDPWHPRPPLPDPPPDGLSVPVPDVAQDVHAEMLVDVLMGAAVYAVATRFPAADDEALKQAESGDLSDLLDGVVADHVQEALGQFDRYLSEQGRRAAAFGRLLAAD